MTTPDRFSERDQNYLRDEQYKDASNLTSRADLHTKYGTAPIKWFPWLASQIGWPAHGEVLEVGCGPGWLWRDVAQILTAPLHVTLTDFSSGMVDAARSLVETFDAIDLVEARAADAQALPFADSSFDLVVANHMLYHVPDPSKAVREFARVLRPDGRLVAGTVGREHLREIFEIRAEVFGGPNRSSTAEVFGNENGAEILSERFGEVEWQGYDDELHCTDPQDVLAFLLSTPPASDASPSERAALEAAVARCFVEGDGTLVITKETGVFFATATNLL